MFPFWLLFLLTTNHALFFFTLQTPVKGVTIPYRPRPAMPVAPVQCMSSQQAAAASAAAPLLIQASGPGGSASPYPFAVPTSEQQQVLYQQLAKLPPGTQLQPQPTYGLLPQPTMVQGMCQFTSTCLQNKLWKLFHTFKSPPSHSYPKQNQ